MTSMTSARIITSRSYQKPTFNVSETHRNLNDEESPSERCSVLTPKKLLEVLGIHGCLVWILSVGNGNSSYLTIDDRLCRRSSSQVEAQ